MYNPRIINEVNDVLIVKESLVLFAECSYTESRLQRVRLQREASFYEQISLHLDH